MPTSAEHMRRQQKMQVALVIDSASVPRWISDLIDELHARGGTRVSAVLVADAQPQKQGLLRRGVIRLGTRSLQRRGGPLTTGSLSGVQVIPLTANEQSKCLPAYDVIVQIGCGRIPHWLSDYARLGLWHFEYNGAKADSAAALLGSMAASKATYELSLCSGGISLFHCSYRVHPLSLGWNLQADVCRRSHILLRALSDFAQGNLPSAGSIEVATPSTEAQRHREREKSLLAFAARWAVRAASHAFGRFWYEPTWVLAFYNRAQLEAEDKMRFTLLWPPEGCNYADPFLFEWHEQTYVFFESWKRDGGKGSIWCAELDANGAPTSPRQVLARDYHLSYPFVFEWQGEIYMLPESWDNGTIEVYRANNFPWEWRLASSLFNFRAVDSTLLEHDGKLWLFTAGVGGAKDTEGTELSIFFADSLFGKWRAHPKNPVVCDVRSARPAGSVFRLGDTLVRPAQDGSVEYGHAITLNQIEVLSETDYREVPFATIQPDRIPGIHATHTVNQEGPIGVLDAIVRLSPLSRVRGKPSSISGARLEPVVGNAINRLQNTRAASGPLSRPHVEQHRCA